MHNHFSILNTRQVALSLILPFLVSGCITNKSKLAESGLDPYVNCEEAHADQVLVVTLTIPDVLDGYAFRIPFRKVDPDAGTFFGGGGSIFNATGPDGGMNGNIGIEASTDDALALRIDLLWTTAKTKGALNERVDIPIGSTGQDNLSDTGKVAWRFDAPKRE